MIDMLCAMGRRMWKRFKTPLALAAMAGLLGFAGYQLYCAVFLNVVLTGPRGGSYMNFQEHPYWFVFGVALWTAVTLFGIGFMAAAWVEKSRLSRRSNRDFIAPTPYRENPPR
jgi:hypothetical protein